MKVHPQTPKTQFTFFVKLLDTLVGLAAYSLGAFFNFQLFSQQGGKDQALCIIYGSLGVVFDVMKVTFTAEGLRRMNAVILALAVGFSCVSLTSSALNMLSTWKATAEALEADPTEVKRLALQTQLSTIQVQINSETKRLDAGGVQYRTDAENTRKSLEALRMKQDALLEELSSIPARAAREIQEQNGYFGAIPASAKTRDYLNLIFRFCIAVFLELGGWTSIYLLVRKDASMMHPVPQLEQYIFDKAHVAHRAKTILNGTAHTLCGRAFTPCEAPHGKYLICPECSGKE